VADSFRFKVEGIDQLRVDLRLLGGKMQDMKSAFTDIAAEGARVAFLLSPKRSGKLANSIRHTKAANYARISAGGSRAPYAGRVNYQKGFSTLGYHFMQRASKAIEPTIVPRLRVHIDRLIAERGWA
jgi:hypothetical protein